MILANSILPFIITNPLKLGLVWAILGLGVFITYKILDVADLSVEGVLPLTAIITIICINNGIPAILTVFISLFVGALCGLITSSLTLYLKIPSLLAGIIMMTALFSFVLTFSNGYIAISEEKSTIFTDICKSLVNAMGNKNAMWANFLGTFIITFIIAFVLGAFIYFFFGTKMGVAIRATGKNKAMAKAQGINTNMMTLIGMAIAGGCVGIAGSLLGQMQTDASSTMGKGTIVIGLAIIFLGQTILFRGRQFWMQLLAILLGGYIYWLIMTLIQVIPGFNSSYIYLVQGILMIIVMVIPYVIDLIASKVKKRGAANA